MATGQRMQTQRQVRLVAFCILLVLVRQHLQRLDRLVRF
jgi:hypothetical protein